MLELRMAYHDPSEETSTAASVVVPRGNPQQVFVQPVDVKEFYNQHMVTPIPGLRNTQPAILKPDLMWDYRWPTTGPYRGMTAPPFSWEREALDGFGEVTEAQSQRWAALSERLRQIESTIGKLSGALALINSLRTDIDNIDEILVSADEAQGEALDMALDNAQAAMDQLEERIEGLLGSEGGLSRKTIMPMAVIAGGAVLLGGVFFLWRQQQNRGF